MTPVTFQGLSNRNPLSYREESVQLNMEGITAITSMA
jgi:hypothetical protein